MHSAKLDLALQSIIGQGKLGQTILEYNELDLIHLLQRPPYLLFTDFNSSDQLLMFRVHFALYNALYRLREVWLLQQKAVIDIELTRIRCLPYYCQQSEQLSAPDPIREYYLDWQNFDSTSEQDVVNMLSDFWQKMSAFLIDKTDCQQAHKILGSKEGDNIKRIKQNYKSLCLVHHPDRGGEAEAFNKVHWAWQILSSVDKVN